MHMSVKKILLAEDDLDDQNLFKTFLQHRTDIHIMPIAGNGVLLCDMLKQINEDVLLPHLIILDQNMPKLNGLQTLQLLKGDSRYARIPVFVYSTYMDDKLRTECLTYGAQGVLTKPITKNGYDEMIDIFLKRSL
jgi:CheY-like chemotaxis protein